MKGDGKPRLPPQIQIGGGWLFLLVLLAAGLAAVTAFLVVVRKLAWTEPAVLVCASGALWFSLRAVLVFAGHLK